MGQSHSASCRPSWCACCEGRKDGPFFRKGVWQTQDGAVTHSVYDDLREGLDPKRPLEARQPLPAAMGDGRRGLSGFYEDELVTCFVPRDPSAALHLLVVPREHIPNVNGLQRGDASHLLLLERMRKVGETQLRLCGEQLGWPPDVAHSFVFHVPPFNSINHLHLHCLVAPYDSLRKKLKYWGGTPWCRTWEEARSRLLAHGPSVAQADGAAGERRSQGLVGPSATGPARL